MRKVIVASARGKRIFVYTASLLGAPLLAMPFVKGTREFALAIMGWGAILSFSSSYLLQVEVKVKSRSLLSRKLLATSLITLTVGLSMLVGAVVYLIQR